MCCERQMTFYPNTNSYHCLFVGMYYLGGNIDIWGCSKKVTPHDINPVVGEWSNTTFYERK
jgi:hypothetical protein